MGVRRNSFRIFGIAAAVGVAVSVPRPSGAAEYCVTCSGPAAMYACVIVGMPMDAPSDSRYQLRCIQDLALQGGHETCSVPRSAPSPCPGTVRAVSAEAVSPIIPAPAAAAQSPAAAEAAPPPPSGDAAVASPDPAAAPAPKVPRTVEELAAQTVVASKQSLKKAGDAVTGTAKKASDQVGNAGSAVGTAAKKTWDCLTSLFSAC